jgi:hypothetical protein
MTLLGERRLAADVELDAIDWWLVRLEAKPLERRGFAVMRTAVPESRARTHLTDSKPESRS